MDGEHHCIDDPTEVFDLINERDEVIGTVLRGQAHANPALLHRSVQVLIFGAGGRLLLQRRSARKDLFPGYYCASASGHVAEGDDYAETAEREVREELGIALPLAYAGKRLVYSPTETEMTALFLARSDGPFSFHPGETDGGAFFTLAELHAGREDTVPMTPALHAALAMLDTPEGAAALRRLLA
jgi:16S rRNA (adenine1518-N6/adenine1519-N6)-dimethyltransferase